MKYSWKLIYCFISQLPCQWYVFEGCVLVYWIMSLVTDYKSYSFIFPCSLTLLACYCAHLSLELDIIVD